MQYNYYFDICALCIIATIAITTMSRKAVPAYRQKAYGLLVLAIFVATAAERVETFLQMHPVNAPWYHGAEMTFGSIYFLAHLFSATSYMLYIMSVLDIYVNFRELKNFMQVAFGYLVGVVFVAINLFVPVLFYYSEDGLYHRGDYIGIYYVIAFYYIATGVSLMLRYNKLMRSKTRLFIASYVVFVVIGIALQFFFPSLLIENFCNTVSATLVFITLQNPSEMVDDGLNMLNRKAFLEGLDLKVKRKEPHSTIFVTIDNVGALSAEIGYKQAQNVVKLIANYLRNVGFKEYGLQSYAYRYAEYMFAVTIHSKDDEKIRQLLEKIALRLNEPWNSSGMAIRVEGHCFLMRYPVNYMTTAELMSRIDIVTQDIPTAEETIVDIDSVEFKELKKARDYDNTARISLDKKASVIKYQPVLSKIYKINYSADVIFFPLDKDGNEIDLRKHIPDVKTTQTLMDVDEYVYRRACRALSFWNDGDKKGKYRAVVGLSQGEISKNDFVRRIKKILREENAEASWISLKLTETTVTTMNKVAEHNLRLLGEMNSYIIVDKFGSGYGDLDRILSLPVFQINLDISVLRMAQASEKMKLVAEGIVNLFHDVSIFVGATEIENEEDKMMAEELGCDFLIGDYMGEPMQDSSYVKFIDAYFEEG
ncbi:MAG: EAL domain-containing protein [Butyrivibrio sp.]|uniref:GGDEF domain-containing phosphodiesterase n=1 Tax=Butyrivibrio sp. TaxID=28121 RepID=UPI0025BC7C95|nr:GGDEF domain-containing protein [Butyrivibrio sp.]MBQ6588218.1 EAL domain-containing protein [Butyrivibrio sp.]